MFDEIKSLLHWAEWGLSVEREAGRSRLVHESKDQTIARLLALANAAICRECHGYRVRHDALCKACDGTGNVLKVQLPR